MAYTTAVATAAVCCGCGLSSHSSEGCGRMVPVVTSQCWVLSPVPLFSAAPTTVDNDAFLDFHTTTILTVLLNVCACSVHTTRCKASVWSICLSRLMTSELYCSRKSYIVLVNADTWTAYVSALLSEGQYTCFIMTMTWTMFRVHTRQWPSRKGISRKQNLFLASGMLFQPSWSCRALTSGK